MKILINFSDDKFRRAQKFNSKTGLKFGNFYKVIFFSPQNIDKEFIQKGDN